MAETAPLHQPQEVASAIVATGTEDPAFPFPLPRVTIRFCTQCKWMLRAAYVSWLLYHIRYSLFHHSCHCHNLINHYSLFLYIHKYSRYSHRTTSIIISS